MLLRIQGIQRRMVLVVNFGIFFLKKIYIVVAICGLVHDVEAMFHLP